MSGLRVAIMHGRLTPDEKDRVMTAFAAGRVDIARLDDGDQGRRQRAQRDSHGRMDAERFGVSSSGSGRPGRAGPQPGLCLLVTEARRVPGAGAAGRRRRDVGRLPALPARPEAAPGGRRARLRAGGPPSSLKMLRLLEDKELIAVARGSGLRPSAGPTLTRAPSRPQGGDRRPLGPLRADFLDKA